MPSRRYVPLLTESADVRGFADDDVLDGVQQLDARGVGVVIEATHTCMTIRGVRKPNSICTTSAMRGAFRTNVSTRAELMALVYGSRG